jgi:tetratricopeptide (TPR) repeat protein
LHPAKKRDEFLLTMAKKEENKDLLENPEVIKEKLAGAEHWIEDNPKIVFGVLGAIVLVVGGFFGYRYWAASQDDQAQREMFQAIRYFEADSLNLALNGDGNNLGFRQIIEDYGMTDAGKLANFYVGFIYLKQKQFKPAILYLEDFKAKDLLVQARAYSLIGDAYMELKDYENAVTYYNRAADYKPNKFFSPVYLMKAALAYEKLNQNEKAKAIYQRIIDQYWDSNEYQDARKMKARIEINS